MSTQFTNLNVAALLEALPDGTAKVALDETLQVTTRALIAILAELQEIKVVLEKAAEE